MALRLNPAITGETSPWQSWAAWPGPQMTEKDLTSFENENGLRKT